MNSNSAKPTFAVVIFFSVAFSLGIYFMFAAVQGDYGVFRRVEIRAEAAALQMERDRLSQTVAALHSKTRRLSDDYLDLDLLDQQARDILGLVRADEVVFR